MRQVDPPGQMLRVVPKIPLKVRWDDPFLKPERFVDMVTLNMRLGLPDLADELEACAMHLRMLAKELP
jgi:hypothetical protein